MLRFELVRITDGAGQSTSPTRTIAVPDNAAGADLYLWWKRRGFELRHVREPSSEAER